MEIATGMLYHFYTVTKDGKTILQYVPFGDYEPIYQPPLDEMALHFDFIGFL